MQATYKMIGTDGVEYGPVDLNDFQNWVREGRVEGATNVMRSDQESWSTASSFPELGVRDRVGSAVGTSDEPALDADDAAELDAKIKSSASWFYWIAALTLINSVASFMGSEWGFYLGFYALQALGYAVLQEAIVLRAVVFGVGIVTALAFGGLGIMARRKHAWAFAAGVVTYGLDSVLTLLTFSPIAIALHAWALVSLILGVKAVIRWKKGQREVIS